MKRESPLLAALVVGALGVVLLALPQRYELLPKGSPVAIAALLIAVMTVAYLARGRGPWTRIEYFSVLAFAAFATLLEILVLSHLLADMAFHTGQLGALQLLSTAVGIWLGNSVIFALVYWKLDRDDFEFPTATSPKARPNWQPEFVDYLFLAYNTSTAFSPTDALPLTGRAKALMMTQSLISLVTIVAVAARAINILGS